MILSTAVSILLLSLLPNSLGQRAGFGPGQQEWGYVTVRPKAHMFWWLYFTTAKVPSYYDKPLLIWLQGGPGSSSTGYGNFAELGPLDVFLNNRNYTWVKDYNVMFIDNPVGAGFSYVEDPEAYVETNAEIAQDLLTCMKEFYKTLPKFAKVPVYVTSESYGGKMAIEFVNLWYKAEKSGTIDSNLKGVALGDSWISPIDSVLTWAPYLLHAGLVDQMGHDKIDNVAQKALEAVKRGAWVAATDYFSRTQSAIMQVAGNVDFYNILYKKRNIRFAKNLVRTKPILDDPVPTDVADPLIMAIMNDKVKRTLNLNVTWGKQSSDVFRILARDFMKPVTEQVELALNTTDLEVFVFTGNLDLIVDTPGTVKWLERLRWKHSNNFEQSRRVPLDVNGYIEGYVKTYGHLKVYWIDRAGHMVPSDNPTGMAALLTDLTRNAYN